MIDSLEAGGIRMEPPHQQTHMVVLNHTAKYDIAWLAQLGTRVLDDIHFVRQQEVFEPIPVAGSHAMTS